MLQAIERKRQGGWDTEGMLEQRSRAEYYHFREHLSWQAAPQCLLFHITLVLARLVDVTGHSQMWRLSQKSMPGRVCVPGMSESSGKNQRKRGGDGERWHRTWMDIQINNAVCGQTVSLSMGYHLLHRGTPWSIAHKYTCTLLTHTHTLTHVLCTRGLWSSQSHFFFYTNVTSVKKIVLSFTPIGLMEAMAERAGGRDWA